MKLPAKRNARLMLATLVVGVVCSPSQAQTVSPSGDDVTVELIQLLVDQGLLKQEQAASLLQRARSRAAQRRDDASPASTQARPGDVRVPYISESVRKQIREEVKQEVMAQAKEENWAQPNAVPDWVSRIRIEGDVRVRDESRLFDGRNGTEIVDYAAFNSKGPIPTVVGNQQNPYDLPWLNTRKDRRDLWRYRARVGVKADISDEWSSAIRLASGSDDNPVSTSDTLGGGMRKKDIWLDQAYMTYRPAKSTAVTLGRSSNPYLSTDLLFADDLEFDGVSLKYSQLPVDRALALFGSFGAFALEYANSPWSADTAMQGGTENKWLLGGQMGATWKPSSDNTLTGALAYHYFSNVTGRRSSPCVLYSSKDSCDSDWSRPAFMQKGNTLFLLRDIQQWSTDTSNWNEWQYVGLASKFRLLDVNLSWDTRIFSEMMFRLDGNYVRNLAYDKDEMINRAGGAGNIVNSRDDLSTVKSGPNAWMLQASFGRGLKLENQGDWRMFAGYKYIQPDSMPDAYNDSSFHMGGTNAQGYFLGAAYAMHKSVMGQISWSSSKEIYGAPLSIDVLRLDLNARF